MFFLPDVILYCCILHNILLGQIPIEVEQLLSILRSEGLDVDLNPGTRIPPVVNANAANDVRIEFGRLKRQSLGVNLSTRCRPT